MLNNQMVHPFITIHRCLTTLGRLDSHQMQRKGRTSATAAPPPSGPSAMAERQKFGASEFCRLQLAN